MKSNYSRAISILGLLFLLVACGEGEDNTITEQLPTPENIIMATPSEVLTQTEEPLQASPIPPSVTPTRPTATPSITFTSTLLITPITPSPTLAQSTPSEGIIIIGSEEQTPPFALSAVPQATSIATAEIVIIPPLDGTNLVATEAPLLSGRLEMGISEFNALTQAGETHRYTFFGNSGERVSILANLDPSDDSTLNPFLEIQAPNGEIVASNDDMLAGIPDALIANFSVPATGVYTVYLKSADQLSQGKYILTLNNTPLTVRDVLRGEARHGLPNREVLATYGGREVWEVELEVGDIVSVAVQAEDPASGLDVMTELVSPDGQSIAFDSDSGGGKDAYIDGVSITEAGRYRIHVAARNNASVGAYVLWWQLLNEIPTSQPPTATPIPSPTPIPTNPPARDTLEFSLATGESFTYRIYAEAGQTVNIVVLGQNGFDPVLRVSDPIAKIIVEVDDVGDSADPRASFLSALTGLYNLEISGFEGAGGDFTLNYIVR